jgi:hypothetical protein
MLPVCSGYPKRGNNILGVVYEPAARNVMLDARNRSQPYQATNTVHSMLSLRTGMRKTGRD